MTIRTQNLTLSNLRLNRLNRMIIPNHRTNSHVLLFWINMIKLKHDRIVLATTDTRMRTQIVVQELTPLKTVPFIVLLYPLLLLFLVSGIPFSLILAIASTATALWREITIGMFYTSHSLL